MGVWRWLDYFKPGEKGMGQQPRAQLLTEQQAADFLQPFLLHKNAAEWLQSDRRSDPVISFLLIDGKPHYLQDDLLEFINQLVQPAQMYFIEGVPAGIDRRTGNERRAGNDRRFHAEIQLQPTVERRIYVKPDRRLRGPLDRRGK
ncbi:hypothetical protein HNQ59_001998 [Chitinivorax tropicus]|uniref:Uncharacterized protein n=1 Tax=Chitinivorax tropicus TaxID=714531 RepID=A0A840MNX8_9PROT|nr:hypothetical protein [Chitinivorax tropicus]MBB5018707.1 hypothetical protein [Chitinivorax tropicus]